MEHGHIQGLGQIFGVPLIISGTGKATDFKLGGYIYRANANKSPLKILEKRERSVSRGCPIFWGTLYYLRNGQSYALQILKEHS